ncbi:MAG: sugar ABC transporter ATP-binding protein [Spirochaetales bacterium]|nr:sugar ABC transporter ATP-binding protein [Spirochaetales bacterium]
MSDYILDARGIRKSFGGVKALKGVDLSIRRGEIHCLAGENGCGKSTLIKVISGFYEADGGQFALDGESFTKIAPAEAIRRGLQVIYQDFSVFPNLSVMENLAFNMELMKGHRLVNRKRMRHIAEEAISRINFEVDLDERVENLPVADKQLIAISRALLYDARLIIMDEPTTALTKKEVRSLFDLIRKLQAQGISILFVSHKLDEVFEISEGYTILRNGQNVAHGDTKDLDAKKFAYHMTGREFAEETFQPQIVESNPVVSARGLSSYGAYSHVDFDLHPGEILGITGLLGSGRTELVQTLFGLQTHDEGQLLFEGKEVRFTNVKQAVEKGVGYVAEDRLTEGLFLPQSITLNTIVSHLDDLCSKTGFLDQSQVNTEVNHWIQELSVAASDPQQPVQTLSGGNQQKVVLARWLANDLKVLILNGPTVGVDIGSKYDIHSLLRRLAHAGLAIIVISDDLPEIRATCSRVLVMRDGSIIAEANPATTSEARLGELITGQA